MNGSNRLDYSLPSIGPIRRYTYDKNGARISEDEPAPSQAGRTLEYDGLGRLEWATDFGTTYRLEYDPLSRVTHAPDANLTFGYDGANITRVGADSINQTWSFVHGPGVDDPLMARFMSLDGAGNIQRAVTFYLGTDGEGREVAAGDPQGNDAWADLDFSAHGGKYAGGARNAQTFAADRSSAGDERKLSFFRNRWYDQATGRWTQEDPIGLAGGLNLYQFNGNNPVMFSDPFGLICAGRGNCTQSDPGVIAQGDEAEREWMEYENERIGQVLRGAVGLVHDLWYSCGEMPCIGLAPQAAPEITAPYKRPVGATTPAQRAAVQGQPCALCGQTAETMIAGHKRALVVEYYKTGTVDLRAARSLDAVQPECPTCSARGGAFLAMYSRLQKLLRGFDY